MDKKDFEFLILPYIEFSDDFSIGNITFYPFQKSGKKFIKEKWLYEKIEILLQCFTHFNFDKLDYIQYCDGILINQNMNAKIILNPFDLVDLLAYVSLKTELIKPNNWDIKRVIVTKNKEIYFNIDDNLRFPESHLTKLVFHPPDFLERINFEQSRFIPKKFSEGSGDSELLNALLFCYSKSKEGKQRSEYQRIITAIKFRNQSERLEYQYKPNIRIILMASAFEALFNLSDLEIQTSFSNSINILLGSCNEELISWAKDFYRLRSDIVHGNTSEPNIKYKSSIKNIKPHILHYRIAKNIFDECLKTRLYLMGLLDSYQYSRSYGLDLISAILTPNKKKILDILRLDPINICKEPIATIEFLKHVNSIRELDESTTNEDYTKLLSYIVQILKESIKILLEDKNINNKYSKTLNEVLSTIDQIVFIEKLYLELYFMIGKYNQDEEKLWENWKINNYFTTNNIISIIQKITNLIR